MGSGGPGKSSCGVFRWRGRCEVPCPPPPGTGTCWPGERMPGRPSPWGAGGAGGWRSCVLVSLVPREGVRRAGKGGWQGGGLQTNSAPCPLCPAPGGSVQDLALCCWLGAPGTVHAGKKVRSRMGRNLPCAWSCCWPRACISSPRPQPFSLYFYKYIERNIYDAKCNRDETPHWPGGPCVSISPETVTYLVLLGVLVVQDRVLGCLHFFLIIVTIIIIIIVLLFPHFLLGADGEPHPAAPGQGCGALPALQGSSLTVPNV